MKRLLPPLCVLFLFFFCILHPSEAIPGASAGLSLWYCTVLPTLLPCMILSGYLISTGLMEKLSPGPFAFVTGWFCGYPMGAKTVADLYRKGKISKEYGDLLLILCCEPSPMFLTGYLCTGMLHLSPFLILPCLLCVYLPPVICFGLCLAVQKETLRKKALPESKPDTDSSRLPEKESFLSCFLSFEEAMMNGFLILAKVGGYLMLFTMLSYLFRNRFRSPIQAALIPGLLEMTSGIAFTIQSGLSRTLTVSLCFAFAAFGGLSGFAQTISVTGGTPLSKRRFFFWKVLQALMTFFLLLIFFPLLSS